MDNITFRSRYIMVLLFILCFETVIFRTASVALPEQSWMKPPQNSRPETENKFSNRPSTYQNDVISLPLPSWDPLTSNSYPIIRVYLCISQLNTQFPNSAWIIERHAIAAMNEWFTHGGSDIRLVYKGSLSASHAACTDMRPGREPMSSGSIVITAVTELRHTFFPNICYPTSTQVWSRPRSAPYSSGDMIYAARIILASGESCSQRNWNAYPWPSGPYDDLIVGEYDYWTALLHEFGHALGLPDDNLVPSVMNSPLPIYPTRIRHLFRKDITLLRQTYGPIRSLPRHTSSTGSNVFLPPLYQSEPLNVFTMGQSACFQPSPPFIGKNYFIANTEVGQKVEGVVSTYITDSAASVNYVYEHHEESNLPPAVACGDGSYMLVYVDPDGFVKAKWSSDVQTWFAVALPVGLQSGVTPTIAYVPWNHFFLLEVVNPRNGQISLLISRDGGASFVLERTSGESFMPIGLTCIQSTQECVAMISSLGTNFGRKSVSVFTNDGSLWGIYASLPSYSSFGEAVASSYDIGETKAIRLSIRNDFQYSYTRIVDSVQGNAGPSIQRIEFLSYSIERTNDWRRPVSDSTPAALWDPLLGKWVVWYTYEARYSAEYFFYAP